MGLDDRRWSCRPRLWMLLCAERWADYWGGLVGACARWCRGEIPVERIEGQGAAGASDR
jgi:hypothetical protein